MSSRRFGSVQSPHLGKGYASNRKEYLEAHRYKLSGSWCRITIDSMSDTGRKNFTDKVEETITPDSQKSTLDLAKEKATGVYDDVASKLTSTEHKSVGQTAADTAGDAKADIKDAAGSVKGGESHHSGLFDQAQEYLHTGQETAKNYADKAQEYVNSDAAKGYIKNAGDYVHKASEYFQNKTGGGETK